MKKFYYWFLAFVVTAAAAYYQRKTGPTYPKRTEVNVNGMSYDLKLVRSLGLDERPEIKLAITDTTMRAKLFYRRYPVNEEYQMEDFSYREYPVNSYIMNKVFKIHEERGFYAEVPRQPAAGKIQYYLELTDSGGTRSLFREAPVVIRFKGVVPALFLLPHVLLMFVAMLFSTLAGLMSIRKHPSYKKFTLRTLVLFTAGGIILGPIVQYYAFGEFWTGIPYGWDLTDNKTLIALLFWILAVIMNRRKERPIFTALAAMVLLLVYSIPHSLFGSELNYDSGEVIQGIIFNFFMK